VEDQIKTITKLPASLHHDIFKQIAKIDLNLELLLLESNRILGPVLNFPLSWFEPAAAPWDRLIALWVRTSGAWLGIFTIVMGAPLFEEWLRSKGDRIAGIKPMTWFLWAVEIPLHGIAALPAAYLHYHLDKKADESNYWSRVKTHFLFNAAVVLFNPDALSLVLATIGLAWQTTTAVADQATYVFNKLLTTHDAPVFLELCARVLVKASSMFQSWTARTLNSLTKVTTILKNPPTLSDTAFVDEFAERLTTSGATYVIVTPISNV